MILTDSCGNDLLTDKEELGERNGRRLDLPEED